MESIAEYTDGKQEECRGSLSWELELDAMRMDQMKKKREYTPLQSHPDF
jgi:hypothetical protein